LKGEIDRKSDEQGLEGFTIKWQNGKTIKETDMEPVIIDNDTCIQCGMCALECPAEIITEQENNIVLQHSERCIFCGHCKAVCPEDAIRIPSLDDQEFMAMSYSDVAIDPDRLMNFFRFRRSVRQYKDKPVEI
jgi:ferredoxin